MPNIYVNSNDGYVRMTHTSWASARDAVSGNLSSSTSTLSSYGVSAFASAGRGGSTTYYVSRSFFYFDTSGISGEVDSATLKVYGVGTGGGDLIAVKSDLTISSLGTADYDAIEGWDTSTGANGSGAGDQESNVTKYSNEITTWSTSGYNDIALNATAKTDMKNTNTLYLCLINFDNDLKDITPTGTSTRSGVTYSDYTGTSRDPYIEYTLVPSTNNSIFFGTNF
tara:strand:+ start:1082 stop:1756 length:675 start_codon:yes stop_codon:yes gene_type:complete